MHKTIKNLLNIENKVKQKLNENENFKIPRIIAVSKTFKIDYIKPLIQHGHCDFGENKVQEALEKWSLVKKENNKIKLHLIGKLQTNKAKFAVNLFDYIHSLDNEKLANKISKLQNEYNVKNKLFIQVNIGNEDQKSGILENHLLDFYNYCKELGLNIVGLMCIPPIGDSSIHFKKLNDLNHKLGLKDLSMGMSSDYLNAIDNGSTFLRIGSEIFGSRS